MEDLLIIFVILAFFACVFIIIIIINIFTDGIKYPKLKKEFEDLKKEKTTLRQHKEYEIRELNRNYTKEIEDLHKQYRTKIFNLDSDFKDKIYNYTKEIEDLKAETKIKELQAKEKFLKNELEIKKELANYKLNPIMINLYNEYYEKVTKRHQDYFIYKTRPSIKSAEIIANFKNDYKNLQIENRQLKLILSQFIPDEEIDNKESKEESSFDVEEKAYKYVRLPKEQWEKLTYVEKLDVVLERYKNSWKDKLNIGLEFERYCGYLYEKKGYQVKYWGILNGKSDGGIDLVAKSKTKTLYIQCKYWGTSKTIRENTISQLFGSALKMALDNGETYETFIKKIKSEKIRIILLTKTEISEEAKSFCEKLNVIYQEKIEIKQNYPRVKLVYGEEKIFYIPTDLQYDNISFGSTNKEYGRAFTCKEAEEKGYRHCYRWRNL